ncbi:MAG: UDP-N-acetylmuramate dehydrogenase [Clostridia bacterium]|nr:UDP-N-acetylmuramate dehydrogenase [Clostridia bacterium]
MKPGRLTGAEGMICKDILFDEIKAVCPAEKDAPMSQHTTFRTGGPADVLAAPRNAEELLKLLAVCESAGVRCCVLGKGSNVLVKDEGFRGVIVVPGGDFCRIEMQGDVIRAGSAATLSELYLFALKYSVGGFERLAGIPGTVGGAVRMNAGAYDSEIADVIVACTYVENGRIVTAPKELLELSYRHSIFCDSEKRVIISADFRLPEPGRDPDEIRAVFRDYSARRAASQPLSLPSAGSTFKRPEGHHASKLIDGCGLKGYTFGGAGVSEKHAGFIVNNGNATSGDVLHVIEHVRQVVFDRTGVRLETEVEIL